MKCDQCENEATVHEVVRKGGQHAERHLCEQCAKKIGISVQHMPINELIQKYVLQQAGAMAGAPEKAEPASGATARTCATCGLDYAEFRKTGLLGCPDCYAAFETPLEPLLERAHEGGSRHVGKSPKREAGGDAGGRIGARADEHAARLRERTEQLKILNKQLDAAVKAEQYERAAALRDEIRRVADPDASRAVTLPKKGPDAIA